MIDVHCLTHKQDDRYFPLLKKQMETEEDVCFHIVQNGNNIGLGRTAGFLRGDAPYVSYVDYDDLIEPGIFTKINEVMETGVPWCYTDEMLIDEEGKHLQPGWSSNPELYNETILGFMRINKNEHVHHIITFRRELFTPKMFYIMKQLHELPEVYLITELAGYHHKHIHEVGCFWRQHADSSLKKHECYRNGGGMK